MRHVTTAPLPPRPPANSRTHTLWRVLHFKPLLAKKRRACWHEWLIWNKINVWGKIWINLVQTWPLMRSFISYRILPYLWYVQILGKCVQWSAKSSCLPWNVSEFESRYYLISITMGPQCQGIVEKLSRSQDQGFNDYPKHNWITVFKEHWRGLRRESQFKQLFYFLVCLLS